MIKEGLNIEGDTKEKPPKIGRRRFLETLGIGGAAVFLTASEATAQSLKDILGAIVVEGGKRLAESEEREKIGKETLKQTRKLNENFELEMPQNPNILLNDLEIRVGGYSYSWGFSEHSKAIAGLIQNRSQGVFGGSSVVSMEKVREETAEREELRENPEVDQSTIPKRGTIKREDMELDAAFDIITSRKDLDVFFNRFGISFNSQGLDLEKTKSLVLGSLTFRDPATQLERNFMVFGGALDYRRFNFSTVLGGRGMRLQEQTNDRERQYYKAIFNALDNGAKVLKELEQKGQVNILHKNTDEGKFMPPETSR